MKALFIIFLTVCSFIAASAQDAGRTKELELKVQRLEERVAKLEGISMRSQETPEAKKMMKVARQHAEEERTKFNAGDISSAEELY